MKQKLENGQEDSDESGLRALIKRIACSFWFVVAALFACGFFVGYRLSGSNSLQPHKLLNLCGLILTLLGAVVLSEIFANPWWKAFCVKRVAPAILWILTVSPSGSFVAGIVAQFLHKPSAQTVTGFSLAFWTYSMFALGFFNEIVVFPNLPFFSREIEARWKWMGLLLVLSGIVAQLVAAAIDLAR